jgi:hypothetical protein
MSVSPRSSRLIDRVQLDPIKLSEIKRYASATCGAAAQSCPPPGVEIGAP